MSNPAISSLRPANGDLHPAPSHVASRRARRADRCVLPVLALILVPIAAAAPPAAAPAAAGSFPDGSYPVRFMKDFGWLDAPADTLALFDVIETAWWNSEGETAATLAAAKQLNPDLVRMVYVNPLGLGVPEVGDPQHVVNRFLPEVDESWFAHNEFGEHVHFDQWPEMELMNLTSKCPRVGGRTWGEFFARFMVEQVLTTGLWEGVHWDYMVKTLDWANAYIDGSFDMDMDGVPDHPDSLNAWWEQGYGQLLALFRQLDGWSRFAVGNGTGLFYDYVNGRYYESFPREGWTENILQGDIWRREGRAPAMLQIGSRAAPNDYQRWRFGLCSALLIDGMSWQEPPDGSGYNATIYDEYAVDLGRPLGERYEIGTEEVAAFDFELGTPPGVELSCRAGRAWLTTESSQVIAGSRSLVGAPDAPPQTYNVFLCTDPDVWPLTPLSTYTLEFDYRVLEALPPEGRLYARTQSDSDQGASRVTIVELSDLAAGDTGHARANFTLRGFPGYYVYFGLKLGGMVALDDIRITEGLGGVFRRDFEYGVSLVNPDPGPRTVDLGGVYYRFPGTQDPVTNSGEEVSMLTLAGEDGILLVYEPGMGGPSGVENPGGSGTNTGTGDPETSPRMALAPFVYPNPARMSLVPAVTFAGVPAGGTVEIMTVDGRIVRRLEEKAAIDGRVGWDLRTMHARPVFPGLYVAVVRDGERRTVRTLRLALRR